MITCISEFATSINAVLVGFGILGAQDDALTDNHFKPLVGLNCGSKLQFAAARVSGDEVVAHSNA